MNNQDELIKLFIKDSPLALAMLDANLHYIACSDRWLQDYDLKINPISRHHYEIFPEITDEWKEIHQLCLQGQEIRREEELFVRTNGKQQWLRWAIKPWHKANNQIGGLLFYTEDITKRKEAEQLHEKNNRLYQTLIRNMNEGAILINLDGDVLEMNPAAFNILECSRTDSSDFTISELFSDLSDIDLLPLNINNILFDKEPATATATARNLINKIIGLKTKQGNLKWLNLSTQIIRDENSTSISGIYLLFNDVTDRQEIERKLSLEKQKFEIAANAAGLGFWEWNLDTNSIKWDKRTAKIYGCAPEEVNTVEDWLKHIAPMDHQYFSNSLDKIKQSGIDLNIEVEIIHPQGKRFVRLFARLQNTARGNRSIYGVHYDFTLRKQAELALAENESRLSNLLENTEDVLYVYDVNEQKFLFVSSSVQNLTGVKADKWLKDPPNFYQLIYPEDLPGVFSIIETSTLPNIELEFRIVKANSEHPIWVLSKSKVVENEGKTLVFGLLVDIQNKKEAEFRELREKTKLEGIIQATRVGTWQWYIEENRMEYNERWAEMLGYELEELQPTTPGTWRNLIHPDDLPKAMSLVQSCFNGEIEYYDFECRLKHKEGTWKWVQDKGQIVKRDQKGNPILMLGTHLDITERKKQEQERLENLELLTLQNQRLRSFAYIVSHNLRSHSSNITMLIDLIKTELNQKSDLLDLLEVSSNRLAETLEHLNSVLNVTNTQNKTKTKVRLASIIDEVLKMTYFDLQKINAEIVTQIDNQLFVYGYRDYIENIIHQLIDNAIKFRSQQRNLKIELQVYKDRGQIVIQLKDNGSGIDLEKQKSKLFGMYQVFHKMPNARGLGLFLLKNQVETMDGKISVDSAIEQGTTFKIFFDESL